MLEYFSRLVARTVTSLKIVILNSIFIALNCKHLALKDQDYGENMSVAATVNRCCVF